LDLACSPIHFGRRRREMIGIEAGGRGGGTRRTRGSARRGSGLSGARPGVLQGLDTTSCKMKTPVATSHSEFSLARLSAIGPEHAGSPRSAANIPRLDQAALDAAHLLSRTEGIIPALESVTPSPVLPSASPNEQRGPRHPQSSGRATRTGTYSRAGSNLSAFPIQCPPVCPIRPASPTIRRIGASGELGIVAYITAGDPSLDATLKICLALGAPVWTVIELACLSDPLADGADDQRASERSLKAGTTLAGVLDLVAGSRVFASSMFSSAQNSHFADGTRKICFRRLNAGLTASRHRPHARRNPKTIAHSARHHLEYDFPRCADFHGRAPWRKIAACSSGFLYLISQPA